MMDRSGLAGDADRQVIMVADGQQVSRKLQMRSIFTNMGLSSELLVAMPNHIGTPAETGEYHPDEFRRIPTMPSNLDLVIMLYHLWILLHSAGMETRFR